LRYDQDDGISHSIRFGSGAVKPARGKPRGCEVVSLKVENIAPHGYAVDRATVRQNKTGLPVRCEITDQTRQAID
jgi:hypothetical protein